MRRPSSPASRAVPRLPMLLGLLLPCVACSSGTDDSGEGGTGGSAGTPVLELIRRNNDLFRESYKVYCASCPCGAFHDVSAEAEACFVSVLDVYPRLRPAFIEELQCSIARSEERLTCLESAGDCDQTDACWDASDHTCEDGIVDEELEAQFIAEVQQRCGDL